MLLRALNRSVSQSSTQSYAEKDNSAQLCSYLCVPPRLNKTRLIAALQVEPSLQ